MLPQPRLTTKCSCSALLLASVVLILVSYETVGWTQSLFLNLGTSCLGSVLVMWLVEMAANNHREIERQKGQAAALKRLRPHLEEYLATFFVPSKSAAAQKHPPGCITDLASGLEHFRQATENILDRYSLYLDTDLTLLLEAVNTTAFMRLFAGRGTGVPLTDAPGSGYCMLVVPAVQEKLRTHLSLLKALIDSFNAKVGDNFRISIDDSLWERCRCIPAGCCHNGRNDGST
jgi:hypothetical protein